MIDKTLQDAYLNLLKENTLLHAQKKQIVDSAEKAIRHADEEIQKLQLNIKSILEEVVDLISMRLPDSPERTCLEIEIANLAPLKIGADGKEKPREN